jgi:NurA domain-containing protein
MPLDFKQLIGQVAAMSDGLGNTARDQAKRLERALATWSDAWPDADRVRGKVEVAKTSWLLARPLEAPGVYPGAPVTLPGWRVLATDGSQIESNRHDIAPCFLVNIGEVTLDYGARPGCTITQEPILSFTPEDMQPLYGNEYRPADGAVVGTVRDTYELSRLAALVRQSNLPGAALVDGTLILWRDETNPKGLAKLDPADLKRRRLDAMLDLFEAGKAKGIPVVGYVSSPGGQDVINSLKVMICPEHPIDCDRCPFTPRGTRPGAVHDKPCDAVDRTGDRALFQRLLQPGERSPLFWSGAPVLQAYGEHQIAFCYLNTGCEVARLEVPAWVALEPEAMSRAHAISLDQARRGLGYPVALAEAHEAAVVRGADRESFLSLVSRRLARDGHPVLWSRKAFRKRGALV